MYLLILVFPLTMLILSALHRRGTFKEPGSGGYTSKAARKSAKSWAYTQRIAPNILRKWGVLFLALGVVYNVAAILLPFPATFANTTAAILVMAVASWGTVYIEMEHQLRIYNETMAGEE